MQKTIVGQAPAKLTTVRRWSTSSVLFCSFGYEECEWRPARDPPTEAAMMMHARRTNVTSSAILNCFLLRFSADSHATVRPRGDCAPWSGAHSGSCWTARENRCQKRAPGAAGAKFHSLHCARGFSVACVSIGPDPGGCMCAAYGAGPVETKLAICIGPEGDAPSWFADDSCDSPWPASPWTGAGSRPGTNLPSDRRSMTEARFSDLRAVPVRPSAALSPPPKKENRWENREARFDPAPLA